MVKAIRSASQKKPATSVIFMRPLLLRTPMKNVEPTSNMLGKSDGQGRDGVEGAEINEGDQRGQDGAGDQAQKHHHVCFGRNDWM